MAPAPDDTVLRLDDGETITDLERRRLVLLADCEEISITWSRYAPGERGPGLHVHREHTDAFYVLEGELAFAVGPEAEPLRLGAGGFVAVPPNVIHSFANESGAETSFINLHAPDMGFAAYLRAARDGTPATWDSFDPPADGGRPATGALVTGPREGERLLSGGHPVLLKGTRPELCVAEWTLDGALDGLGHRSHRSHRIDSYFPLGEARVLGAHAPDDGLANLLRRTAG